MVRIREPLTAQQLETTTERWLVIDHIPAAMPTVTGPKAKAPLIPASSREAGNRSARPLHSLSVLAFDQERLERKILALRQARRSVPPEVAQQYQDVVQRSQWQRAQLEQGVLPSAGSMQAIWSASCTSIQRLPGAWAMMEAGRLRRRHCIGGTWWRASCSDSAGEAHPGLQAPQPDARQSSRATEQTSRQSADSWFWTRPVQALGPRGIGTAQSPQPGWLGLGESCLHIQEHLEQGG